jgi:branched-chain amino acid transport system substrate-binding protein
MQALRDNFEHGQKRRLVTGVKNQFFTAIKLVATIAAIFLLMACSKGAEEAEKKAKAASPAKIASPVAAADTIKIGLNYPKTGPYFVLGLDQLRAAQLATQEINAVGGILGKKIELVIRDSKSNAGISKSNVNEMIDRHGVKMIFGGSSSSVAIAAGGICQKKGIPFFATLTYSTDTTGKDGYRHTFRECYDGWMGAKVLSRYLNSNFSGKKYFYMTADYTWGWTTEKSLRQLTGTEDKSQHTGALIPFPSATPEDYKRALNEAKAANADVLVVVLFGDDMVRTLKIAQFTGIKDQMQIVVPNLTLGMAENAGAEVMEGVLGALPWSWNIPYLYNYTKGQKFVETFSAKFGRYPCCSGASAYTILYEYKAAVERARTFDSAAVIRALEGHEYQLLKDKQLWRTFDHQSVQTVYAVRGKPVAEVARDKYKADYFEIIDVLSGEEAAITLENWKAARIAAGKPPQLERLPGE